MYMYMFYFMLHHVFEYFPTRTCDLPLPGLTTNCLRTPPPPQPKNKHLPYKGQEIGFVIICLSFWVFLSKE